MYVVTPFAKGAKATPNNLMQFAPLAPDATFGYTADEGRYVSQISIEVQREAEKSH